MNGGTEATRESVVNGKINRENEGADERWPERI